MKFFLAIVFSILQTLSQAEPIPANRPIIKFSQNKQFFGVCVPKSFFGEDSFCAIYKSDTKELMFKVDSLYADFSVSNDGKQLFVINTEFNSLKDSMHWSLAIYSSTDCKTLYLFSDIVPKSDEGFMYTMPSTMLDEKQYRATYKELTYKVSLSKFQVSLSKKTKDQVSYSRLSGVEEETNFQFGFGLDKLVAENDSILKDIIGFTGMTRIYDNDLAEKYIFIKLIIEADGNIVDLMVFAQNGKMSNLDKGKRDQELEARIKEKINNYDFSKNSVLEGAPYWYFSEPIYLISKE